MSTALKETYIEKVAVSYLTEHYYAKCSHNNKLQHQLQAYTTDGKRADGIIVWEKAPNKVRLVSIEAKSATTISNLKARWNKEKLSETSLLLAEFIVFILFALLYSFLRIRIPLDGPALLLILLLVYFFRIPLRILLQNVFANFFKTASVFEQVNLYPGNEVWIAIGYDTFKANRAEKLKAFIAECKRRKLGLLEIAPEGYPPQVLVHPKFKPSFRKQDFLDFYKRESKIRQYINGTSNSFLPRINSSKAEIQFYLNKLIYAISIVVFLFFFTDSNKELRRSQKESPRLDQITLTDIPSEFQQPIIKKKEAPIDYSEIIEKAPENVEIVEETVQAEKTIEAIPYTAYNPPVCNFPFEGKKFIVKDMIVTSNEAALERIRLLKNMGFTNSNYFYIPCSNIANEQDAWCVYAYNPRSSQAIAYDYLKKYKYIFRIHQLDSSESEILHIEEG